MCIICIKPKGVALPNENIIARCEYTNPDGFGFATPSTRYRTMNRLDFENHLHSDVKRDEPAIIHCRIATHGSLKRSNCHPFYDEETGVAFAHNGMLNITPKGDWTDSETAFRKIFVPIIKKHGLYSDELDNAVENIIGSSRFAFMGPNGGIRLFGHWIRMGKYFYSHYI